MENKFIDFDNELAEKFNGVISEILNGDKDKQVYTIGFITTDDYYGFYITLDYVGPKGERNVDEFTEWDDNAYVGEKGFMYTSIVNVIDAIDFDFTAKKTKDKWDVATSLMNILAKHIKAIPNEIFTEAGHNREDIFFFATQGDGNYMDEMYAESRKLFNSSETVE